MKDLFDLPFEEPEPEPEPEPEAPSAPPAPEVPAPPVRRVFSVGELTASVRELLESRFAEVWVEGEISNCRPWNTGHVYFTLKDASAQLRAVMFRSAARLLRFRLEDGLHVIVRGRLSVYEPKGEYQIVCEHMEPHGLGALQLAFDQLKQRLKGEGLFEAARKRRLPALPRRIGIVTSLDGAAIRDIIKVLRRRHPNAHLVIRPTRVQGDGAASDLARALKAVQRVPGVDVVILARGGGSIEDLWAFNEEVVARAIAACAVPVVSGVGHETDVTIADFVADVRAPTPSAAAEIVVAAKDEFCRHVDRLGERLRAAARGRVQRLGALVNRLTSRPAYAGWPARLALKGRHASELSHDVRRAALASITRTGRRYQLLRLRLDAQALGRRLAQVGARLTRADAALRAAGARPCERAAARLANAAARLDTLSPLAVLGRGYAVCWNEDRSAILRDASAAAPGDRVNVRLDKGELACRVEERRPE